MVRHRDTRTSDPLARQPGALGEQLAGDALASGASRGAARRRRREERDARGGGEGGEERERTVQGALGERILKVARVQQEELEEEEAAEAAARGGYEAGAGGAMGLPPGRGGGVQLSAQGLAAALGGGPLGTAAAAAASSDSEADDSDDGIGGDWPQGRDDGDFLGDNELDEDDERALAAFMNPEGSVAPRSLADIIMEKIEAQAAAGDLPSQREQALEVDDEGRRLVRGMDPKVREGGTQEAAARLSLLEAVRTRSGAAGSSAHSLGGVLLGARAAAARTR